MRSKLLQRSKTPAAAIVVCTAIKPYHGRTTEDLITHSLEYCDTIKDINNCHGLPFGLPLSTDYLWITLGLPYANGLLVILERVDIGYIGYYLDTVVLSEILISHPPDYRDIERDFIGHVRYYLDTVVLSDPPISRCHCGHKATSGQ